MGFGDGTSLLDVAALERELEDLLGRDVDVVSEAGLRLPDDAGVLSEARLL
jgi:predicted nucleotidyltransferase